MTELSIHTPINAVGKPTESAEPATPLTPGGLLRRQRQSRGWAVPEMARQLRDAASAGGARLPAQDSLVAIIQRWERGHGGVSERYHLYYCRAFDLPADQYGTSPPAPKVEAIEQAITCSSDD